MSREPRAKSAPPSLADAPATVRFTIYGLEGVIDPPTCSHLSAGVCGRARRTNAPRRHNTEKGAATMAAVRVSHAAPKTTCAPPRAACTERALQTP